MLRANNRDSETTKRRSANRSSCGLASLGHVRNLKDSHVVIMQDVKTRNGGKTWHIVHAPVPNSLRPIVEEYFQRDIHLHQAQQINRSKCKIALRFQWKGLLKTNVDGVANTVSYSFSDCVKTGETFTNINLPIVSCNILPPSLIMS